MTVTKVLQDQAGIQYGGVVDKSEADPRDSMNNVLFTGEFMRGRFDQPMKVYASNIRAVLGYDPDNMDYVAVEDALATGAPFVWVQRIGQAETPCTCTSYKFEKNYAYSDILSLTDNQHVRYELKINNRVFGALDVEQSSVSLSTALGMVYNSVNLENGLEGLSYHYIGSDNSGYLHYENRLTECARVTLIGKVIEYENLKGVDGVDSTVFNQIIEFFSQDLCGYEPE